MIVSVQVGKVNQKDMWCRLVTENKKKSFDHRGSPSG
jgi:hypothetical protein